MLHTCRVLLDRWLPTLIGWALLISATGLIGLAIVGRPYATVRQLAWQRGLMTQQAERLGEQLDHYRQIQVALQQRDPALLQRLAYHYLHVKPTDCEQVLAPAATDADDRATTVDDWVYQPLPVVGLDYPAAPMAARQTAHLTSDLRGIGIALAGIGLVAVGLLTGERSTSQSKL